MDVEDGFILGIYNYCDSWCSCCRFTSRCRLFADLAKHDAAASGDLTEVAEAPQHASDYRRPSKWLEEALADFDESKIHDLPPPPPMPARYRSLSRQAMEYSFGFFKWFEASGQTHSDDPRDPMAVVSHFSGLIASKTRRAMEGLNEDDGNRDFPPDFEGSAKVVVDGIERSMAAWRELASQGRVEAGIASNFGLQLRWIVGEIDDLIPHGRTFVRAAFDEPDEVAKLEAADWS